MHVHRKLVTAALAAGLFTITAIHAEEKRIRREDLPPAVEKTVAEQSKGATIKGFSKEVEHGKTYYEAELRVDGHGRDISVAENGNIVEIEEEVALDSVPPAVNEALIEAAGSGKIIKVESLSKNGGLVAYEAVVQAGKKQHEVQVGPDGKKLAHPE
jgi:uncharacterized membrane protein YkoI